MSNDSYALSTLTDESAPIIVCIPDVDNEDSDVFEEKEEDIAVSATLLQPARSSNVARSIERIAVSFFISFSFRNTQQMKKP